MRLQCFGIITRTHFVCLTCHTGCAVSATLSLNPDVINFYKLLQYIDAALGKCKRLCPQKRNVPNGFVLQFSKTCRTIDDQSAAKGYRVRAGLRVIWFRERNQQSLNIRRQVSGQMVGGINSH